MANLAQHITREEGEDMARTLAPSNTWSHVLTEAPLPTLAGATGAPADPACMSPGKWLKKAADRR